MGDAWPSIASPSQNLFAQWVEKAQNRSRFEDGTVQSAVQHTKKRWVFSLGWGWLSTDDYDDLVDHFDDNVGASFPWTHPLTATVHTVYYRDDKLPEAQYVGTGAGVRLAGLILEEA